MAIHSPTASSVINGEKKKKTRQKIYDAIANRPRKGNATSSSDADNNPLTGGGVKPAKTHDEGAIQRALKHDERVKQVRQNQLDTAKAWANRAGAEIDESIQRGADTAAFLDPSRSPDTVNPADPRMTPEDVKRMGARYSGVAAAPGTAAAGSFSRGDAIQTGQKSNRIKQLTRRLNDPNVPEVIKQNIRQHLAGGSRANQIQGAVGTRRFDNKNVHEAVKVANSDMRTAIDEKNAAARENTTLRRTIAEDDREYRLNVAQWQQEVQSKNTRELREASEGYLEEAARLREPTEGPGGMIVEPSDEQIRRAEKLEQWADIAQREYRKRMGLGNGDPKPEGEGGGSPPTKEPETQDGITIKQPEPDGESKGEPEEVEPARFFADDKPKLQEAQSYFTNNAFVLDGTRYDYFTLESAAKEAMEEGLSESEAWGMAIKGMLKLQKRAQKQGQ